MNELQTIHISKRPRGAFDTQMYDANCDCGWAFSSHDTDLVDSESRTHLVEQHTNGEIRRNFLRLN